MLKGVNESWNEQVPVVIFLSFKRTWGIVLVPVM